MTGAAFFQDIAVLTVTAGVIAAIFSRFGWPKVIGYILAGVILNEYTWGGDMFLHPESIHTIGQLGVVFLMLGMGLSFSPRKMRKVRSTVIPAAVLDTLVMTWAGYMI
ncbi:MAG: cation:proton antiporter, partial [Kiritimatiellae bacterium]|nr:cation:proton antiporter [Kiritimatiellia bacterium]